jgi:hypothetical protein
MVSRAAVFTVMEPSIQAEQMAVIALNLAYLYSSSHFYDPGFHLAVQLFHRRIRITKLGQINVDPNLYVLDPLRYEVVDIL